jgi:phage shock protein PspC (stress-responsive transcriptional regulator)
MQSQKRLVRLDDEKMIAGVASGIGRYFGLDPFVVRLVFVASSFLGGAGLVVYVVAALILPRESHGVVSEQPTHGSELVRWFQRQRMLVKVVVVMLLFLVVGGFANAHGLFVWGAALLAVGVFLLVRPDEPTDPRPHAVVPTEQPVGERPLTTEAYGNPTPPPEPPSTAPRYVRRSDALPIVGIGVAFLSAALLVALGHHGVIDLSVQHFLAAMVLVLGTTMLVGAWFGRARTLTPVAFFLVFLTAVSSIAGVRLDNGTGHVDNRPSSIAELQQGYSFGAGREILDLSALPTGDVTSPVHITLSAGDLVIVVPRNRTVTVYASVGFGHIDALDSALSGMRKHTSVTHESFDTFAAAPTLVVDAHNGFGRILVTDDPDSEELSRR